jgi:hypothetical protein
MRAGRDRGQLGCRVMRIPADEEIRVLHEKHAPAGDAFDLVYTHCRIGSAGFASRHTGVGLSPGDVVRPAQVVPVTDAASTSTVRLGRRVQPLPYAGHRDPVAGSPP